MAKFINVPTGTWLNFTTKDVEVLYDVDVIAVPDGDTTRVRLAHGESKTATVTVPGTIGIDERGPIPVGPAGVPSGIRNSVCRL